MNLKVDVLEQEEGPALGGAMLAAVGCGVYPDVKSAADRIVKIRETLEPDPDLTAKYEARYREFTRLYPMIRPFFQ